MLTNCSFRVSKQKERTELIGKAVNQTQTPLKKINENAIVISPVIQKIKNLTEYLTVMQKVSRIDKQRNQQKKTNRKKGQGFSRINKGSRINFSIYLFSLCWSDHAKNGSWVEKFRYREIMTFFQFNKTILSCRINPFGSTVI